MNWVFEDKEVKSHDDLHPDCTDFVYLITYTDGRKYIGKKRVRSIRRKKPTKAQLAIRKNYARKEMTNLPFVNYVGSHDISDLVIEKKEILYQCSTAKAATYIESALLFEKDAIFIDDYINKNIGGVYFDNDLNGLIK